eukprot:CAMPEP_0178395864 /NCGR_PEP_ID=MMETSP0689_2-20121128/13436_1 /TAXON_ID=160604 /ORGANISM="Amphidinium massartii, Strain CS-259" /LENGTH=70 /DNA_ID=CAMNT_0020016527 /DNA_START=248 /DNA_END=460 /DNA_ORIENTATION=-
MRQAQTIQHQAGDNLSAARVAEQPEAPKYSSTEANCTSLATTSREENTSTGVEPKALRGVSRHCLENASG